MKHEKQLHLHPMPHNRVVAFSTTRHGGCSSGTYGTFNCTPYTGDEPAMVRANQGVLCQLLGISTDRLIIPYQTHSCNLLTIDDAFMHLTVDARHAILQEKDAVMTNMEGMCLCVSTADCIPVLLYDATHNAIAAVHAGWRGTEGRIVEQTLQAMHATYGTVSTDIHAIIGPGISLEAFEVGTKFMRLSQKPVSIWNKLPVGILRKESITSISLPPIACSYLPVECRSLRFTIVASAPILNIAISSRPDVSASNREEY